MDTLISERGRAIVEAAREEVVDGIQRDDQLHRIPNADEPVEHDRYDRGAGGQQGGA